MASHRNRYVKVSLAQPSSTRLQDARVVGQGDDYLLLERAAPKARPAATAKRNRTKATHHEPRPAATSFPPAETPHA